MKRRDFIKYSTFGGASLVVSLKLCAPNKVDAIVSPFGILARAIGYALYYRSQAWFDDRLDAQLGQRELLRRSFRNVVVAEADSPRHRYICGGARQDMSTNLGLTFPRIEQGQATIAGFSGPASLGMAVAAEYLRDNERMQYQQVRSSMLPRLRGGINHDDWRDWTSRSSRMYENTYGDGGVNISYDPVKPFRGGFGVIDVSVKAEQHIKIPPIRVRFD